MSLTDCTVLFSQAGVMEAKSFSHPLQLMISESTDVASLRLIEERDEVSLRRKLCDLTSVLSYPIAGILEDHRILLHSVVCLLRDHVVLANVTDHIVEEHSTLDPKIDGVKEVVEVFPRARVSNEAGDLGQLLSQESSHSLNFLIKIGADDRGWGRAANLTFCSSAISGREESRSIRRGVVKLCGQGQFEVWCRMSSQRTEGRHSVERDERLLRDGLLLWLEDGRVEQVIS